MNWFRICAVFVTAFFALSCSSSSPKPTGSGSGGITGSGSGGVDGGGATIADHYVLTTNASTVATGPSDALVTQLAMEHIPTEIEVVASAVFFSYQILNVQNAAGLDGFYESRLREMMLGIAAEYPSLAMPAPQAFLSQETTKAQSALTAADFNCECSQSYDALIAKGLTTIGSKLIERTIKATYGAAALKLFEGLVRSYESTKSLGAIKRDEAYAAVKAIADALGGTAAYAQALGYIGAVVVGAAVTDVLAAVVVVTAAVTLLIDAYNAFLNGQDWRASCLSWKFRPNNASGCLTLCNSIWVDTQTDPRYCGGCQNECSSSSSCMKGVCECPYGLTNCPAITQKDGRLLYLCSAKPDGFDCPGTLIGSTIAFFLKCHAENKTDFLCEANVDTPHLTDVTDYDTVWPLVIDTDGKRGTGSIAPQGAMATDHRETISESFTFGSDRRMLTYSAYSTYAVAVWNDLVMNQPLNFCVQFKGYEKITATAALDGNGSVSGTLSYESLDDRPLDFSKPADLCLWDCPQPWTGQYAQHNTLTCTATSACLIHSVPYGRVIDQDDCFK